MGNIVSTRRSGSVPGLGFVRHGTRSALALVLVWAALWMSPASVRATAVSRISLTVRVYRTASVPLALTERALAEAGAVLRSGIVDVTWRNCTGLHSSPACAVPPGPAELLLVVRRRAPCQDPPATLGEALVARARDGRGVLATVYVECVEWLATAGRTDVAVLFGRVVAHELGHLMMRTSAHARRGLMRPNWTPDEVRRNLATDWAFTASDVAEMRQPGTMDQGTPPDLP
jgi:hypothetical protein